MYIIDFHTIADRLLLDMDDVAVARRAWVWLSIIIKYNQLWFRGKQARTDPDNRRRCCFTESEEPKESSRLIFNAARGGADSWKLHGCGFSTLCVCRRSIHPLGNWAACDRAKYSFIYTLCRLDNGSTSGRRLLCIVYANTTRWSLNRFRILINLLIAIVDHAQIKLAQFVKHSLNLFTRIANGYCN